MPKHTLGARIPTAILACNGSQAHFKLPSRGILRFCSLPLAGLICRISLQRCTRLAVHGSVFGTRRSGELVRGISRVAIRMVGLRLSLEKSSNICEFASTCSKVGCIDQSNSRRTPKKKTGMHTEYMLPYARKISPDPEKTRLPEFFTVKPSTSEYVQTDAQHAVPEVLWEPQQQRALHYLLQAALQAQASWFRRSRQSKAACSTRGL